MIEFLKKLFLRNKMLDMSEIVNRLKYHEGCVLFPYKDTRGYLTIGIGRCIEKNPFTVDELKVIGDWKHGITREMAHMLCRNDIDRCISDLRKKVEFFDKLDKERQYVLIDLCFNMGIKGLLKFKNMLLALGTGNWNKAADELLNSKYALQVGKRAIRLASTIRNGRFEI